MEDSSVSALCFTGAAPAFALFLGVALTCLQVAFPLVSGRLLGSVERIVDLARSDHGAEEPVVERVVPPHAEPTAFDAPLVLRHGTHPSVESQVLATMTERHDTANPLALEEQVCFALSVAARGVVAVYRPLLEPMGLTHPQYLVMLALWQYAPLSVRRLGELLQLDPGTLSPLLKRLEAIGYLRRERNAADERSLAITLTPTGQALRVRAEQIPPAVVERLGLPIDELRTLHTALTRVIEAARSPQIAPGQPQSESSAA